MSSGDAMSTPDDLDDAWYVRLPTGEVRVMTLDQLDAAFQDGRISEETEVLQPGTSQWAKLGQVAGIDEEAATPPPPSYAPPVSYAPASYAAPPSYAPAASTDYAHSHSLRPVVSEVSDFEVEPVQFRSSSKRPLLIAAAAVLMLGGLALGLTKFSGSVDAAATAAASMPVAANIAAPVVASLPAPPPAAEPAVTDRLSDEQKRVLLGADKKREAAMQLRKSKNPPSRSLTKAGPAKAVFHKGGSKFDPLNSTL